MNAIAKIPAAPPPVTNGLIPRNMQEAFQLAEMMARGKMMPEHLKNPGDALMVVEQAMRWQMSPFAVAQSTFNIKGKLLFAGTIVAAAIENSGAIQGLIDYQFSGEGPTRKITVIATRKGEAEPRTVDVALKDAQTGNDIWKKQPDQQLVYHGARVWARRWTPGVMLGVYTPEEWREQPADNFAGQTINAEPLSTGQIIGDDIPERVTQAPPKRTVREIVRDKLVSCTTADEVFAVAEIPLVKKALAEAPDAVKEEIGDMLAAALDRVRAKEPEAEPDATTQDAAA